MKAIFWDCDDTLVNSEVIAMGVAIDLLAGETQKQNPLIDIDRHRLVRDYAGWHFDKMIEAFERDHNVRFDYDSITKQKTALTLEGLKKVEPIDDIEVALTDLATDHHFALVTSSEFSRVNLCLDVTSVGDFFPIERRYSGHDSLTPSKHKPLPDIYLHALEVEGVSKEDVVAIEDSASGVASAKAAGIPVIAFVATRRVNSEEERIALGQKLMGAGALFVVADAKELPLAVRSVLHGTYYKLDPKYNVETTIVTQSPFIGTPTP
jgi:beta-phosphoglucomutase-like phosphatase (HAD superfamily)